MAFMQVDFSICIGNENRMAYVRSLPGKETRRLLSRSLFIMVDVFYMNIRNNLFMLFMHANSIYFIDLLF